MSPTLRSSGTQPRLGKAFAVIVLMLTYTACATGPSVDKASEDLVGVHPGNFDQVYMPKGTTIPRLTRVSIAEPTVTMSEHWRRQHRGDLSSRDLERIERDYSRFLREALTKTLEEQTTVQVVAAEHEPDIILRPSLLRLNIYAPDIAVQPARTRQYVETAGNATLNIELVDPQTDRILAQFIDHRETSPGIPGQIERANRATNNRLFIRMMERWSNHLVDYLENEGAVDAR